MQWDPEDPRHKPPSWPELDYLAAQWAERGRVDPKQLPIPQLANRECVHGKLPHDPVQTCGCWEPAC